MFFLAIFFFTCEILKFFQLCFQIPRLQLPQTFYHQISFPKRSKRTKVIYLCSLYELPQTAKLIAVSFSCSDTVGWRNVSMFLSSAGPLSHLGPALSPLCAILSPAFGSRFPEPVCRWAGAGAGAALHSSHPAAAAAGGRRAAVADQYLVQTVLSWLPTRPDAANPTRRTLSSALVCELQVEPCN